MSGSFWIGAAAVAIIGGLSHFSAVQSTSAQRGWTMTLLVLGIVFGPIMFIAEQTTPTIIFGITGILFAFSAFGGFVIGQIYHGMEIVFILEK
jgi:hypothetical protein